MDAFYASVEQRDNAELQGRPVVVAWRGKRSVVCAASYEARTFGVRSAMPAVRAERLCPDAVFVPPNFEKYRDVSRRIREIFLRYTALVEPLSLDEAYLDVSESLRYYDSATAIAKAIRADILTETSLTASAGVSFNKLLAKIASDLCKPNGLRVIRPQEARHVLASLPVTALPGVGPVMASKLAGMGITSIAHVQACDEQELEERLGRWGNRLRELAFGIDERAVEPYRPTLQISAEDTFDEDRPLSELQEAMEVLGNKVWESYLGQSGRVARTVVLKLKTSDFKILTRSVTPAPFPTSAEEFVRVALSLRGKVDLPATTRFRLVGVGLSGLRDQVRSEQQDDLFGPDRARGD